MASILRMGHPTLRLVAQPLDISKIQSSEVQALIEDMYNTMASADGIGLAAPQVGVSIQLAIVESPESSDRYPQSEKTSGIYINPRVTVLDHTVQGMWEGCLSIPGIRGYVERPRKISVHYWDEKAQEHTLEVEGFSAIVLQHEFDHLNGVLFIDRIEDKSKLAFIEEYQAFHLDSD